MNLLLDTHTLLWWHDNPKKLSSKALDVIKDEENNIFISVVNAWEMQIKSHLNRLTLPRGLEEIFGIEMSDNTFSLLKVELSHVYALRALQLHHNDPFDRLLISQARAEDLTLVSIDRDFEMYDVALFW